MSQRRLRDGLCSLPNCILFISLSAFITPLHLKSSSSTTTTTAKKRIDSSRRRTYQKDVVRTPTMLSEAFKMKRPRQRKASDDDENGGVVVGAKKDELINSNLCLNPTTNVGVQEQEVSSTTSNLVLDP